MFACLKQIKNCYRVSQNLVVLITSLNIISHSHTHKHRHMVAEEKQRVNDALETLLSIKEKIGNLRKDLKNDIHESVSTLRKASILIYKQLDNVKEEYNSYRKEVKNTMKGEG